MGAEVDRELLVDVLLARRVQRSRLLDRGGVVERAVEPSVQLLHTRDRGADALAVGQVERDGVGDASLRADVVDDPPKGVFAAGGEHDRGALGGEEPGRGGADAAAGAGDEHHLAGEQADGCDLSVCRHEDSVRAGTRADAGTDSTWLSVSPAWPGGVGPSPGPAGCPPR